MADLESKILIREIGKLGGVGARWVAQFLPTVHYEATLNIAAPLADVRAAILFILKEIGRQSPELPEFSVIYGSGHLNLNPTIVSAAVTPLDSGARVLLRAAAKEGLVRQDSAKIERGYSEQNMSKSSVKKTKHSGAVHKLPEDFRKALSSNREILSLWKDITPLARNEWICWVSSAKKAETRGKRIEVGLSKLKSGMRRPCCWPGCPHR